MLGSLHSCVSTLYAPQLKQFLKCQNNFYRVISTEQRQNSCVCFLVYTKTWNQPFPCRLNKCLEVPMVKNSLLPLERTSNASKHIQYPLYISRCTSIDACTNVVKQCYRNTATYYPLTFISINSYRESLYENIAQDVLPNIFSSYTKISQLIGAMSSANDTDVSKTSVVMNCRDFGNTQNDCRTNDVRMIEQATKSTLYLGSRQNANQFENVHTEDNLIARLSCKIESIKRNSKQAKGTRKRKLMLLLAGACLSCKKSKKDDSFETTDATLTQEQFINADIDETSALIEDVNTKFCKSVPECVKDLPIEKDAQSPVGNSGNNLDQVLVNITSNTEKKDEQFCEIDVDQQKELRGDFQIQNESVFGEFPYASCSTQDITSPNKNKKRRKRLHGNFVRKRNFNFKGKVNRASTSEDNVQTKKRPNYFVAIQVSNPQIISAVRQVQNHVLENEPKLKSALIKPATFHLTILVCHINDSFELERACRALEASYDLLKEKLTEDPLCLTFEGLANFQNKVLYAKLIEDVTLDRLNDIVYHVKTCYEHDINLTDNRKLVPHLTLFKLSKDPTLWKKGIKKIEPSLYQEYNNIKFGVQLVEGLQLLSMLKRKDSNGYYYCEKELLFRVNGSREVLKTNGSYKEELSTTLHKEKEAIRRRISSLTLHQLTQSQNDQDKCSDKDSKPPADGD